MRKFVLSCIIHLLIGISLFANNPLDTLSFKNDYKKMVSSGGNWTIALHNNERYLLVSNKVLNRKLALTLGVVEAATKDGKPLKDGKYGYAGDTFGPQMVTFQSDKKNSVCLYSIVNNLSDHSSVYDKILSNSNANALIETVPLVYSTNDFFVIDINKWIKESSLYDGTFCEYCIPLGMPENNLTKINESIVRKNSFLVQVNRYYNDGKGQTNNWTFGFSLTILPKEGLSIRLANSRFAYFGCSHPFYTSSGKFNNTPIIKRFRVEPRDEDMGKYLAGQLVDPQSQIVFYIDRKMPSCYLDKCIEAVESWNKAFECAGFKNVIIAKQEPLPEEDSTYRFYDLNHSYISWKLSKQANGYGQCVCDPETGEIISARVAIFSSIFNLLKDWYFIQNGLIDTNATKKDIPTWCQSELLKMVITHEIGHSLGLEHNFYGSSSYSVDSLKSKTFLSTKGISSSIMDYCRFDYLLDSTDSVVPLENRVCKLGEYDKFAIEWGYRYYQDTPNEQQTNKQLFARQDTTPALQYKSLVDCRAQMEDLSNDMVYASSKGLSNLEQLLMNPHYWNADDESSKQRIDSQFSALLLHLTQYFDHLNNEIGGTILDNNTALTKRDKQLEIIDTTINLICQSRLWIEQYKQYPALKNIPTSRIDSIYSEIMSSFIHHLEMVATYSYCNNKELSFIMDHITQKVFAFLYSNTKYQQQYCAIQKAFIEQLINYSSKTNDAPLQFKVLCWKKKNDITNTFKNWIQSNKSEDCNDFYLWSIKKMGINPTGVKNNTDNTKISHTII